MRLLVSQAGRCTVTIEGCGPLGAWQDISLRSDRDLGLHEASLCYRLHCSDHEACMVAWGE